LKRPLARATDKALSASRPFHSATFFAAPLHSSADSNFLPDQARSCSFVSTTIDYEPVKPETMTPDERLAEIGQILALGLVRLHARKSSSRSDDRKDSSVDFPPDRSSHATPLRSGKA
jgi:hypothetical protein